MKTFKISLNVNGKISTNYGDVPLNMLEKFTRVSGNLWNEFLGQWVLQSELVDYYQLVNPGAQKASERFKKKKGMLPIRDLNFQYAYYVNDCNAEEAIEYAERALFDGAGNPVYLPEILALKAGADFDITKFNYSKIIQGKINESNSKLVNQ